jgi:hypothetical protein
VGRASPHEKITFRDGIPLIAFIVIAFIVIAFIVIAFIVIAFIVIASIVVAFIGQPGLALPKCNPMIPCSSSRPSSISALPG